MLRPHEPNPSPEPTFESLESQRVDLGAIKVHRALPNRQRRSIGPFVFLDAFGPSDRLFDVGCHPHTGIATVTFLTSGRVTHRDSLGSELTVGPGEISLMTAGRGICHTETGIEGPLMGVQLWLALPYTQRDCTPAYHHFDDLPYFEEPGGRITVAMGKNQGYEASTTTRQPTVLLKVDVEGTLQLPLDYNLEHGVYVLSGSVEIDGNPLETGDFVYLGTRGYGFEAKGKATVIVLGGTPVDAPYVLWWNFLADDHETVKMFRDAWNDRHQAFGDVPDSQRLEAPSLPGESA